MYEKSLLILNGSCRKNKTSYIFAKTLKERWENTGNKAEIIHIIEYFDGTKDLDSIKDIIKRNNIICLVSPIYVDTLPYPTIWFLEKLSTEFSNLLLYKRFFAIGQCGFPDVSLCESLLGSCKCFAETVKMKWLGGLGYGGGAIIDGRSMEDLGKKGKKITHALDLALADIFKDKEISSKPQELLNIKIPKLLLYPLSFILNYRAKKTGKRYGVSDLTAKPYLK